MDSASRHYRAHTGTIATQHECGEGDTHFSQKATEEGHTADTVPGNQRSGLAGAIRNLRWFLMAAVMTASEVSAQPPQMPPADPDIPANKADVFRLEQEIAKLRAEMKAGFAAVRQDMKSQADATDKKIADSEKRVMTEIGKVGKSLEDFRAEQLAVNAKTFEKFDSFGKKLDETHKLATETKTVADKVAADFADDIKKRPQAVTVVQGAPTVSLTINGQPPSDVRPLRYEVYPVTQQVVAYYPGNVVHALPSYSYNWWWNAYASEYTHWNPCWGGYSSYQYAYRYRYGAVSVIPAYVVRPW